MKCEAFWNIKTVISYCLESFAVYPSSTLNDHLIVAQQQMNVSSGISTIHVAYMYIKLDKERN